jgi:hypothetical protein
VTIDIKTTVKPIELTTETKRVPNGLTSVQRRVRLPEDLMARYSDCSATERGQAWTDGYFISQNDYIVFYRIISALGGEIIRTSTDPLFIELKSRVYKGDNHCQLLLTVIEDLLT